MDMSDVILNRRMTRDFSRRKIPSEIVMSVCRLALRAPTAGNCHGVELLTIADDDLLATFWKATSDEQWLEKNTDSGVRRAPTVIVPLYCSESYTQRYAMDDKAGSALYKKPAADWDVPFWLTDTSFATMTLLLAAQDHGLGALFFQLHRPERVLLDAFGIPQEYKTIGAIALGYPDEKKNVSPGTTKGLSAPSHPRIHIDHW